MSEDKIVKICHQRSAKGFIEFAKELNELFSEGYEICTDDNMQDCPKFFNRPQVTMVKRKLKEAIPVDKNGEVVEVTETSPLEQLEATTKKDDLLAFAKANNIEVPEDVKLPLAIKKLLRETLSKPTEAAVKEEKSSEDGTEK